MESLTGLRVCVALLAVTSVLQIGVIIVLLTRLRALSRFVGMMPRTRMRNFITARSTGW